MPKGKKHIEPTELDSFQKYLNKEMNTEEQHVFERHMLNDAFESDALEGLSGRPQDELNSDLSMLQKQLNTPRRKIRSYAALFAAASIVLLVGIISILWNLAPTSTVHVSQNTVPPAELNVLDDEEITELADEQITSVDSDEQDLSPVKEFVKRDESKAQTPEVENPTMVVKPMRLKAFEKVSLANKEKVDDQLVLRSAVNKDKEQESLMVDYGTLRGEPLNSSSGFVSSEELNQIPIKAMKKAKSNAKPVEPIQESLMANAITEEQVEEPHEHHVFDVVTSENTKDTTIAVPHEQYYSLSEVVTVEVSDDDKRRINEFVPAEPYGGLEEYQINIEKALSYPKTGSGKKEQVVALVTIHTNGKIKAIKIKRSPSEAFSVEVIKAIRNGAKWRAATNRGLPSEDKVKLKFTFEPEKRIE